MSVSLLRTVAFSVAAAALMVFFGMPAAKAHPPLPGTCSTTTPLDCRYSPVFSFSDIHIFDTIFRDPSRSNYPVPIRVRYARDVPAGPRPVVIFNHGGMTNANGRTGSSEWSTLMAKAGYIVVHPSRLPVPNPAAFTTTCQDNEVSTDPGPCAAFVGHHLYGPMNTDFLISLFPQITARVQANDPLMLGSLNRNKVIVAGWSGGSSVVAANAGAWKQFADAGPVYDFKTTRPIGFFGVSTQGPDYAGFSGGFRSLSYDGIDNRPFLTITGKGDTNGKFSEGRTVAFLRSTSGGKYLSWDTLLHPNHATMNHSDCATPIRLLHCQYIESAGLAFLDAVAWNLGAAKRWLASDAYITLTQGAIELHRR
ncbi:MAG: hypothetical protein KDK89_17830 [Alphaproteobacteria bacterium]|nr:hypothetical protein [Alphaproteobacteria bacterium]